MTAIVQAIHPVLMAKDVAASVRFYRTREFHVGDPGQNSLQFYQSL